MAKKYKDGLYVREGHLRLVGSNVNGKFVISSPLTTYSPHKDAIYGLMIGYEFVEDPLQYIIDLRNKADWIHGILEELSKLSSTNISVANKSLGTGTFTNSLLEERLAEYEKSLEKEESFRDEHGIERTVEDSEMRDHHGNIPHPIDKKYNPKRTDHHRRQ